MFAWARRYWRTVAQVGSSSTPRRAEKAWIVASSDSWYRGASSIARPRSAATSQKVAASAAQMSRNDTAYRRLLGIRLPSPGRRDTSRLVPTIT